MYEIISLILFILRILSTIIIIQVILSWIIRNPMNPIMMALNKVTGPILDPIRKILPSTGAFDFSPIVAIILLNIISRLITRF